VRLATVGIGYSDGYPIAFAGKAQVLIRGRRFPVLEAITANHLMVDLSDDGRIVIGDEVTLIDPDRAPLAADDLAEKTGLRYGNPDRLNPFSPGVLGCALTGTDDGPIDLAGQRLYNR
jgi:alanine racemase